MLGLGVFVVGGIIAAVVTAMNMGDTGAPGNPSGAVVPAAGGGTPGATPNDRQPAQSAVAGVPATAVLRVEAGGFDPVALTVPRGSKVVVQVAGRDCTLTVNGDAVGQTLQGGDEYTWSADKPGHYDFACKGDDRPGAGVLVP